MLQIKNIHKVYRSEDVETHALVGGLDHYDSGDLIIDGVSTKEYRSRDWDAYREKKLKYTSMSLLTALNLSKTTCLPSVLVARIQSKRYAVSKL